MSEEVQLRFRHHTGDIGPITFNETTSIAEVKERVLAEWPKEGPMSKEIVPDFKPESLRFILSGKFVDSAKLLRDYKKDMGELKADTIVTMHIVIRANAPATKPAGAANPEKQEQKGCSCIIS